MKVIFILPRETKLDPETKCLLYIGRNTNGRGYPCVRIGSKTLLLHRVIFEKVFGKIPEQVHHICRNKKCLNAAHYQNTTDQEHKQLHLRTHCTNGHELTFDNVYLHENGVGGVARVCRTCKRDYERKVRRKYR